MNDFVSQWSNSIRCSLWLYMQHHHVVSFREINSNPVSSHFLFSFSLEMWDVIKGFPVMSSFQLRPSSQHFTNKKFCNSMQMKYGYSSSPWWHPLHLEWGYCIQIVYYVRRMGHFRVQITHITIFLFSHAEFLKTRWASDEVSSQQKKKSSSYDTRIPFSSESGVRVMITSLFLIKSWLHTSLLIIF